MSLPLGHIDHLGKACALFTLQEDQAIALCADGRGWSCQSNCAVGELFA